MSSDPRDVNAELLKCGTEIIQHGICIHCITKYRPPEELKVAYIIAISENSVACQNY